MAHYKVVYKVDDYATPHSRFYTALNESTARSMFTATCEESLIGSSTEVLKVEEILNPDEDCCDQSSCECNDK